MIIKIYEYIHIYYITFKALKGVLKTPIFPTILKPFNDHGAESYSDQPEIFTSDSSYFFIIKGFCMNFFFCSGYKDIRKEAGHLWTGYCYILFFFISGAFFASILSTVPVDHKWGQTNFMPLNALQSMAFSISRGCFNIFKCFPYFLTVWAYFSSKLFEIL